MVAEYKSKQEKFQAAKWWAADEWRLVREMERVMDVELFLRIQDQWAEDSPHHVVILHEMFQHVATKGWKEVEQIFCQGCWQNLPQLNPEAGIPAIQLVGLETSKDKLLELYLEVYKLCRLPGSPPGEPAILQEVLSFLPDHQGCEEEKALAAMARPCPEVPHSSRSSIPHKEKKNNSVERSLPTVHEAHQKVLAMAATLEKEIERLSHNQNCSELRARSKSRDCQGWSREGQKKRHCQVQFEDKTAPTHPTDPKTRPGEEGTNGKDSDLEEPLELKPAVASFLRGSLDTSKDEANRMFLEPWVLEFSQWVPWEAERCETPEWWTELLIVPGIEDCRKLAREVQASFGCPQQMWELGVREATLQAPPMPPCLCRQRFMLPAESIYACRDIREIPCEREVAYARDLQHWVEENNLPAGGEPQLLAEHVMELREEVKWYLSFTNEVFQGVVLPKEEEDESPKTLSADISKAPMCHSQPPKGGAQNFFGGRKCYTCPN